jgi:hypothetical protein
MRDNAFPDPFMLVSEHKAVLGRTQERYDTSIRYERETGFLYGVLTGMATVFCLFVLGAVLLACAGY